MNDLLINYFKIINEKETEKKKLEKRVSKKAWKSQVK